MKKCMTRLLTLAVCLMLCVCLLPRGAKAFEPVDLTAPMSLTIYANDDFIPLSGISFELHRVATMNESVQFELLPDYADFRGDINEIETTAEWMICAEQMRALTGIREPDYAQTTHADGYAVFDDLEPGLYLVMADRPVEIMPWVYSFTPFMVSVPGLSPVDTWMYDVFSDVKLEKMPARTGVEVVKVWDDAGYERERPQSIYVDLYCDGVHIATKQLHAGNGWSHTFTDLPSAHTYTVKERYVNRWYNVTYEVMNGVLVLRNERITDGTPLPEIPATGQLWWPVPILAGAGMLLIIVGWYINRKWRQEHE